VVVRLTIDTTDSAQVMVGLCIDEKEDKIVQDVERGNSQKVLLLIDTLLKQNRLHPTEIDEVEVNSGPGSFTGIKVGVSLANALGFALNVPVNGGISAKPKYE